MKKHFKIIFTIIIFSLLANGFCFADSISDNSLISKIVQLSKDSWNIELKNKYIYFKECLTQKKQYEDLLSGWLYFNKDNDKLLIGSSGAVYCGYTMKSDLLSKYGYDIIAFGGVYDEDLVELLKLVKDKKYSKIVLFGGINDLNIRASNGIYDIDEYYCATLYRFVNEANKLLTNKNNVYYVKIKELVLGIDYNDESFVTRYNNMAKEINGNIEYFGYKSYEIPFSTTKEYSEHYIHFNNPIVYENLFQAIG